MTVIVCFDTGRGTAFFGKRQCADRAVTERVIELAAGRELVMSAYSASLFKGSGAGAAVTVKDDISAAGPNAVCFAENTDLTAFSGKADELIIFRWNKVYPRDRAEGFFPFDEGMKLVSIRDFAGSSHDRITEEIWRREERKA